VPKSPATSLQEIVCVFGQPVAGNPTQFMMERAFEQAGLDWRYLTLEVAPEDLADAMKGLRAMGFRGANLTIPHKVAVIPLLDSLTPAADIVGAVNCIFRDGEKLCGENTDGKGFLESLKPTIDPAGKMAVILGAGGASRAISVELALAGAAEIQIVNRSAERGEPLVNQLRERCHVQAEFVPWKGDFQVPATARIVINATSIGLNDANARVPVSKDSLVSGMVVADVIFNPARTRFLRDAESRGCTTLDGLGMLVNQAAINFRIWTGVEPDIGTMRDALEEFLSV
jgi:shikimate dehydrogenase